MVTLHSSIVVTRAQSRKYSTRGHFTLIHRGYTSTEETNTALTVTLHSSIVVTRAQNRQIQHSWSLYTHPSWLHEHRTDKYSTHGHFTLIHRGYTSTKQKIQHSRSLYTCPSWLQEHKTKNIALMATLHSSIVVTRAQNRQIQHSWPLYTHPSWLHEHRTDKYSTHGHFTLVHRGYRSTKQTNTALMATLHSSIVVTRAQNRQIQHSWSLYTHPSWLHEHKAENTAHAVTLHSSIVVTRAQNRQIQHSR